MSWVDLVVIGAFGVAVYTGFRRGALLQVFSWGGFIAGLVLGLVLAPKIVSIFAPDNPNRESAQTQIAIYTMIAWLGIAFIVEALTAALGMRVRKKITHAVATRTDQIVGSIIAAVLSLAGSWMIGTAFERGPSPALAKAIKDSAILSGINKIAPPPPAIMAEISRLLQRSGFPEVFSGFNPSLAPGVQPPPASLARDAEILAAAEITYKIEGTGCGGVVDGSGFPIGSDMVVTAAHVVAGTSNTRVIHATNGRSYRGVVVYMDKDKDIAIIRVKLPGRVFTVEDDPARRETDGAAIGYPGGGRRTITPARVRVRTNARGMDIYSRQQVSRSIYVLRALVKQGNSGGPLVDTEGRVRGMIFAAAQNNPEESYALTETEIFRATDRARGRTAAVRTGDCAL